MATRLWDKGDAVNALAHRFTVGSDPEIDRALVRWDALASAAHARMLHKIGILNAAELKSALGGLREILERSDRGEYTIPPELEDCHTAIENDLTEKLGDIGKKIHTGRSRNDQVLVAMRLYLKDRVNSNLQMVGELAQHFNKRIESEGGVPMPGYTHYQPAMPASIGMWLGSYVEWCLDLLREGEALADLIDSNPLGAASGFGVPLALDRDLTTELLGFSRTQRNPINVQNSRGREELRVLNWWNAIAALLEKFACDMVLWSTSEYEFFSLPTALTTGSSIMPQKRNPDVLELVRGSAGKIRARRDELQWVIAKLPSSYHRDFQLTKEPVIVAAVTISDMLEVTGEIVQSFAINQQQLAAKMTVPLYATYHVYAQVRAGVPFREAYQKSAEAFKRGEIDVGMLTQDFSIIEQQLARERAEAATELKAYLRRSAERAARTAPLDSAVFSM